MRGGGGALGSPVRQVRRERGEGGGEGGRGDNIAAASRIYINSDIIMPNYEYHPLLLHDLVAGFAVIFFSSFVFTLDYFFLFFLFFFHDLQRFYFLIDIRTLL